MENVTPGFLMEDPDEIDATGLEKLQILVDQYKHFEEVIKDAEDKLKLLQGRFRGISEEEIPNLLSEFGLSEIKLASGAKIIVKDDASITIKDESRFFLWLKNRSEDDIIKMAMRLMQNRFRRGKAINNPTETQSYLQLKLAQFMIDFLGNRTRIYFFPNLVNRF